MNIFKVLLSLVISCLLVLASQAAPADSAKEQRARAESIVKKQKQLEQREDYYKNLKSGEPIQAYLEAAQIYEALLKSVDDDLSGTDLAGLIDNTYKAYRDDFSGMQADEQWKFAQIIEESGKSHANNVRFQVAAWKYSGKLNILNPALSFGPEVQSGYDPNDFSQRNELTYLGQLRQGEKIFKMLPGNLSPDEHAEFLLDYAKCFCIPGNQKGLPAYGFFHQLTNLAREPHISAQGIRPIRPERNFKLISANKAALSYKAPTSWEAAINDGERFEFLLNETIRTFPAYEAQARAIKAVALQNAFSPAFALKQALEKDAKGNLFNKYCSLLKNLSGDRAIVFDNTQFLGIALPPELAYLEFLKDLAFGLPYDSAIDQANYAASQKGLQIQRILIIPIYLEELINRLDYSRSADEAKKLLANLPEFPKGEDGESLEENMEVDLERLIAQITANRASFADLPDFTFFPDRKSVRLPLLYRNTGTIELSVYKVNTDYLSAEAKKKSETQDSLYSLFYEHGLTSRNELLKKCFTLDRYPNAGKDILNPPAIVKYELAPVPGNRDTLDFLLLPQLESGLYLVEGKIPGEDNHIYKYIHVSGLKTATFPSMNGLAVSVKDRLTGEPKENATVSVLELSASKTRNSSSESEKAPVPPAEKEFSVQTNKDGIAILPMKPSSKTRVEEYGFFISVKHGEESDYLTVRIKSPRNESSYQNRNGIALITDRPVYRPGQTVHWTAWAARTDLQKGGEPAADLSLAIDYDGLKEKENITTDARGMASGSFIIPESVKLKSYSLRIQDREDSPDGTWYSSAQIQVEEYKKQDIDVVISTNKTNFAYGDKVKVTVRAAYFSGEPVTQGTTKITVNKNIWTGFSSKKESLVPEKVLPFNDKGEAVLEFTLPRQTIRPSEEGEDIGESYTITSVTSDASQRQIEKETGIYVMEKPFQLEMSTDTGYGRSGTGMSGKVLFTTADGKPLSAQGDATLSVITPSQDPDAPDRKKVLSWKISTNAKGESALRFVPPAAGYYELEVHFPINEAKSQFLDSKVNFYVLPKSGEDSPSVPPVDKVKIFAEKKTYKAGETAKVLLVTPAEIKSVTIGKSLAYIDEEIRIVRTSSTLTETNWEVTQKNAPNFALAIIQEDHNHWSPPINFAVETAEENLTLASLFVKSGEEDTKPAQAPETTVGAENPSGENSLASPDAKAILPEFEPGDSTSLQVRVTLPDGSPSKNTPVIITVYDKALEELGEDNFSDIQHGTFWKTYRTNSLYSYNGLSEWNFPKADHSGMDSLLGAYMAFVYTSGQEGLEIIDREAVLRPLQGLDKPSLPPNKRDLLALPNIHSKEGNHDESISSFLGSSPFSPFEPDDAAGVYYFLRESKGKIFYNLSRDFTISAFPETPSSPVSWGNTSMKSMAESSDFYSEEPLDETTAVKRRVAYAVPPAAARIRSDFADLLKWSGTLVTDENGLVRLPLVMPDNLTTWRVLAGSVDEKIRTGLLSAEFITSQRFIAQLHTPRFLVAGDISQFTAILRNNTEVDETVKVSLNIEGDTLKLLTEIAPQIQEITVPAQGTASVNWSVLALKEGGVFLNLSAEGERLKDATKQPLPLIIRGAYKGEARSVALNPKARELSMDLSVPEQIDPSLTLLDINVSPGFAPVVVRALPFLSDYPYGCVEQTMNRFIPSVIAKNTLKELSIADIKADAPGNAGPVPAIDENDRHIQAGLNKLAAAQNDDGGWGWFAQGESSPHITAQVVHGLLILMGNEIKDVSFEEMSPDHEGFGLLPDSGSSFSNEKLQMLSNGLGYLKSSEETRLAKLTEKGTKSKASAEDMYVHSILAETGNKSLVNQKMRDILVRDRHEFTPYSLTRLALVLYNQGEKTVLRDIQKALRNLVRTDKASQTAWLSLPANRNWWTWDNDDIETQAAYLKLLTATAPRDATTRSFAKWLATNRENSFYWKSTRDTALAIEALCDYMKNSGEGTKPVTLDVLLDGEIVKTIEYDPARLNEFNGSFTLDASLLKPGNRKLELRRTGGDSEIPVYFAAGLKYFSLEDKLTASGTDLTVKRSIARLTADKNAAGMVDYKKTALSQGAELNSGDIIEVALEVQAANDYQYIMLRDPKPAGCEPFNLVSGYHAQKEEDNAPSFFRWGYYTELADRETRIFLPELPRGNHTITYRLRVERPGIYTALPIQAEAMYTPVLRGNSDENILTINPPAKKTEAKDTDTVKQPVGIGDETNREAFEMAFRIRTGWGQEINYPLAYRWLKKASSDYIPALVTLAHWTLEQTSDPDREKESRDLDKKALTLASSQTQSNDGDVLAAIGHLYLMSDRDWDQHFAADFPDIENRRQRGIILMRRAATQYERAAAEGSGYAAYRLGKLYSGEGILDSPSKALQYYETSAATGFAPALYEAAKIMPDNEKSEAFLRRAIAAKYYPAAELLAERLFARRDGNGIANPDEAAQAVAFLQQAAQAGLPKAQLSIAELLSTGRFLPRDEEKAEFWRAQAYDGHYFSPEPLDETDLPAIDAIKGRHLPDEDILPLSGGGLAKIPLPESLPAHSNRLDGLTDGELIKKWEEGSLPAIEELGKRFAAMDNPVEEIENSLKEYLPETVVQYNTLARQGDTQSALDLARILAESDFPEDRELANRWLELLARENHAQAIQILASREYLGMNPERGVELYSRLADRNDLSSILELRDIFSKSGRGGELNLPRAKAYQAQYDDIHNLKEFLALIKRDMKKQNASVESLVKITEHIIYAAEKQTAQESLLKDARKTLSDLKKKL